MNCKCGNTIEDARAELGLNICKACAFRGNDAARYKGAMISSHKSAPTLQVMSSECWNEQKKYYTPQGARSAVKNFSKHICA